MFSSTYGYIGGGIRGVGDKGKSGPGLGYTFKKIYVLDYIYIYICNLYLYPYPYPYLYVYKYRYRYILTEKCSTQIGKGYEFL